MEISPKAAQEIKKKLEIVAKLQRRAELRAKRRASRPDRFYEIYNDTLRMIREVEESMKETARIKKKRR